MQITSLTVGPVATCCYILSPEGGKSSSGGGKTKVNPPQERVIYKAGEG